MFNYKSLTFSRSRSELDLAGRTAIKGLEGENDKLLDQYADPCWEKHCARVECIRQRLRLTSLRYQRLDDLVQAIGLPKEKLCTYCWDGKEQQCSCGEVAKARLTSPSFRRPRKPFR